MANAYFYSNLAVQTSLSGSISAVALTITVGTTTGFPTSFPYILALDFGGAVEELVKIISAAGTTLTIDPAGRGFGGTSAQSHSLGAVVRHVYNAVDATDFRTHEAAVGAVHGLTGNIVGTTDVQTLTNKTLLAASASTPAVMIQGAPSQSVGLTSWVDSSSNLLAFIGPSGRFVTQPIDTTVVALTANSPTASSQDIARFDINGVVQARFTNNGYFSVTPTVGSTGTASLVNAPSGFNGNLLDLQLNAASKFSVAQNGFTQMPGGFQAGGGGQVSVDVPGSLTLGGPSVIGTANLNNYQGIGGLAQVYKAGNTARTSTTTLTNDPDLTIVVNPNFVYSVHAFLIYSADTAGDFAMGWSLPAGAAMVYNAMGPPTSAAGPTGTVWTSTNVDTDTAQFGGLGTGTNVGLPIHGYLTIAATGGNAILKWAQATSSATATTLKAGSWVRLTRLG